MRSGVRKNFSRLRRHDISCAVNLPLSDESTPRSNWFLRVWPWLVVAVILLFVGLIRVRLLEMPLERDEGEYAYAGQLILQGIPPYELAYNMKLPGTYFAYAIGMAIFGQTISGIHLTLLLVNSLTCIFVFLLGRKLAGVTAGLVACATYGVMSISPAVYGLAAHATQFVVFFAVPGVLLLWNALSSGRKQTFFFSGLMFGLAFMMKQQGVCFGMFAVTMMTWQAIQRRSVFSRNFLLSLAGFSAGMLLPFGIFCLAALIFGDFGRFWFWTFDYARYYAARNTFLHGCQSLSGYLNEAFRVYGGLWLLGAIGLLAGLRATQYRNVLSFVLSFLFFSFLGILPGWVFRYHYFVVLLPAFALVLGLGIEQLKACFSKRRLSWLPPVLLLIVLAETVYEQRQPFFQLTPRQVNRLIYQDDPFLESLPVAEFIRDHSKADAKVAVIGSEPQLYFYSNRHSATGYIYTYALMEAQPYASLMQKEMIKEIETAKPEFLVQVDYKYSWEKLKSSDLTIFQWLEHYTGQFYVPVAEIGRRADGQIASAYGADVAQVAGSLREAIIVYKRKDGLN